MPNYDIVAENLKEEYPYRSQALIEVPKQNALVKVKGGYLAKIEDPPPHKCNPPGFWRRLFNGIQPGCLWICECGSSKRFVHYNGDMFGCWNSVSEDTLNELLEYHNYPNRWKNKDG